MLLATKKKRIVSVGISLTKPIHVGQKTAQNEYVAHCQGVAWHASMLPRNSNASEA